MTMIIELLFCKCIFLLFSIMKEHGGWLLSTNMLPNCAITLFMLLRFSFRNTIQMLFQTLNKNSFCSLFLSLSLRSRSCLFLFAFEIAHFLAAGQYAQSRLSLLSILSFCFFVFSYQQQLLLLLLLYVICILYFPHSSATTQNRMKCSPVHIFTLTG